jgi:hypothetical protein
MQALDTEAETMVFGQFGAVILPYEYDGLGELPHLSEMAATALSILDNEPNGFFLMIEGGRIDHACHDNDIPRSILETTEFDKTVQVAMDWAAGRTDTLILVCADHETGGLTVVANNGAGAWPTVDWSSTGHTEANIPVYAWGMNAKLISGVMDNTEMFEVVTAGPEARNPDPADGAVYNGTFLTLVWEPGVSAVSHDVYLGESFADVNDGTAEVFRGNQANSYFLVGFGVMPNDPYPGGLALGTTYYWRIDEVNEADPNRPWKGDVWSFSIAPETAHRPSPADGSTSVDPNVQLSWMPGLGATWHTVYFGDNFDDVNNAAGGIAQTDTTYTPGPLEPGKQYYWRVDEFDGLTTYKGDVWSFTTLPEPAVTDPNLVGSWMFDEGYGTTAADSSGNGTSISCGCRADNLDTPDNARLPSGKIELDVWTRMAASPRAARLT